jgi:pre-mRNA 3'-end-processing factor FIP1
VPQLSAASLSGAAFPAQRTSTIDVNGNPVYPPQGKEILSVDIDADLAEEQKIWRRPGEDQSDYFNYGFDEFTWELYRQRQVSMANTLQGQKNDMAQMQAMMGGGPMPGMPGMGAGPQGNGGPGGAPPTGPGGGGNAMGPGGMNEQQMQMMMQDMMAQGMDPSQMDFASFMQMAGQGMGGFGGGPGGQQGGGFQQGHQGGGFQQGHQGGGRGGRGGRGRGW